MTEPTSLTLHAVPGLPEIERGTDLARAIGDAMDAANITPAPFDVLVVSHKIVSKAEGRIRLLDDVVVSERAVEIAARTDKDPRVVQVILDESIDIVRERPGLIIARHRNGAVMANAGIDQSNVGDASSDAVLCLPIDGDDSAQRIRGGLRAHWADRPFAVVVCDSVGRAWRRGVIGQAIGAAGLPALVDRRGELDRQGRALKVTYSALADQIASAAELLMGEAAEGRPVVLLRGLSWEGDDAPAASILRPPDEDLFC